MSRLPQCTASGIPITAVGTRFAGSVGSARHISAGAQCEGCAAPGLDKATGVPQLLRSQ